MVTHCHIVLLYIVAFYYISLCTCRLCAFLFLYFYQAHKIKEVPRLARMFLSLMIKGLCQIKHLIVMTCTFFLIIFLIRSSTIFKNDEDPILNAIFTINAWIYLCYSFPHFVSSGQILSFKPHILTLAPTSG